MDKLFDSPFSYDLRPGYKIPLMILHRRAGIENVTTSLWSVAAHAVL